MAANGLIQTQVPFHFFLLNGPPELMMASAISTSKISPPYGAPLVRTWLFSSQHGLAEQSRLLGDLGQPLGTLGELLGGHLVTNTVRMKPWGAM